MSSPGIVLARTVEIRSVEGEQPNYIVTGSAQHSSVTSLPEVTQIVQGSPEAKIIAAGLAGPPGQQGETGATGAPGNATETVTVQNNGLVTLYRGMPVRITSAGQVVAASATNGDEVYGLVYDTSISPGGFGLVAYSGVVEATVGEWETATNTINGLADGETYYLSPVAGLLTISPDVTSVPVLVFVGTAATTTKFRLALSPPIYL